MADTSTPAPMLQLPAGTLTILRRALAEESSPAEAAASVRRIGYESGEAFHRAFRARQSQDGEELGDVSSDAFWEALGEFFGELGWGRLRFEQIHAGVAALESFDWAEAEGQSSGAPSCYYTTGVLADLLGRVAGDDLAVLEVECRAAGADRCRFLLGGEEALEHVYRSVRDGASVMEALERLG